MEQSKKRYWLRGAGVGFGFFILLILLFFLDLFFQYRLSTSLGNSFEVVGFYPGLKISLWLGSFYSIDCSHGTNFFNDECLILIFTIGSLITVVFYTALGAILGAIYGWSKNRKLA